MHASLNVANAVVLIYPVVWSVQLFPFVNIDSTLGVEVLDVSALAAISPCSLSNCSVAGQPSGSTVQIDDTLAAVSWCGASVGLAPLAGRSVGNGPGTRSGPPARGYSHSRRRRRDEGKAGTLSLLMSPLTQVAKMVSKALVSSSNKGHVELKTIFYAASRDTTCR